VAALRRRLALDAAGAQVFVLVVWIRHSRLHVSVHPSRAAAMQLVDQLQEDRPGEVTDWQVALRWPGSGDTGQNWDPTGEQSQQREESDDD
jgi:hypothetical protein